MSHPIPAPKDAELATDSAAGSGLGSMRLFSPFLDLRLGDCMDLMRDAPDNHWDLAIVDPPYGIRGGTRKSGGDSKHRKHQQWKKHLSKWDESPPSPAYFRELERVTANRIIWGGNYMVENLASSPCWLIWDKAQEFSGADFEMAWTSFGSPAKAFRMSRVEAHGGVVKIHPTQKPVALYKWILSKYAEPGQRILDTHMGSGSIAIACHYFGAHLTATEIDEDYFKAACERIENETRQMDLFQENA